MNAVFDPTRRHGGRVNHRVQALVARAWRAVPAYRTLWREAGLNGRDVDIASLAHFRRLPVVTKADLRRFPADERCFGGARGVSRSRVEHSGGSTGEPFATPLSRSTHLRRQWRFLRALTTCGYSPGQCLLLLNTRGSSSLFTRLSNVHNVDLTLGERELAEHCIRLRPRIVYGPLNTLKLLARGMTSATRANVLPTVVISTAEHMSHSDRCTLRRTFGTDPADFYGMSECGLLAWRPPGHGRYTLLDRAFFLEYLPDASEPAVERLILTDLTGGPMPLIRFDTGDLVLRDHQRPGSPVVAFSGREVDCLKLPDGLLLSPYRVTLALEDIGGMERYQVIQRNDLSMDVMLWGNPTVSDSVLTRTGDALRRLTGHGVEVRVRQANGPPPEGLRKFRPIRSEAGEPA